MQFLWQKWVNIGNEPGLSPLAQKRIRILNTVIAIIVMAIFVLAGLDLVEGDTQGFFLGIGFLILILVSSLILYFKYHVIANYYFLSVFITALTIVICLQGEKLGGEFSYFTCSLFVLIFLDRLKDRGIFFTLILIGYLSTRWFLANVGAPLAHTANDFTFNVMFFLNWSCSIWITLIFLNENEKTHKISLQLLADLKDKNEELEDHQTEIKEQNIRLAATNKELERFAFIASHDLKTPLRNVTSFLQLLRRKLNKGKEQPKEVYEYLDFASNNARQMHNLITDILEFSQLNRQGGTIEQVNLNQIIEQVKNNLHIFIEEKSARIHSDNLPIVNGNISQLTLLFQNLIENGIKYNESEIPSIQISYTEISNYFLISIQDNGIGIQDDYSNKIFEMFTRLHNQDQYKGSGIGLATCQKIATQHGGKIELESDPQHGSKFIIHLAKISTPSEKSNSASLEIANV